MKERSDTLKRTGEITLSIIGAVLSVFGILLAGVFRVMGKQQEFANEFVRGYNEALAAEGLSAASEAEALDILNFLVGASTVVLIVAIIALVVGIVAAILFAGNKNPFAASLLLVISAVVILIGSLGSGIITAVLYIIAGIMGFVRKDPNKIKEIDLTDYNDQQPENV